MAGAIDAAIQDGRAFIALGILYSLATLAIMGMGPESNTVALYPVIGIALFVVGVRRFTRKETL